LRFNAGSSIAFNGTFNVSAGTVIFSTNAYINALSIGYSILGLTVDFTGNSSSILYLNNITINYSTSRLLINPINSIAGSSVAVIYTKNTGTPTAFSNSYISGGGYQYSFSWTGASSNWVGYLTRVNTPTPPPYPPYAPDSASRNKFLANSLSLAAQSHGLDDIYNRIDISAGEKSNAWVGLYGGGISIEDFSVNSFGGAFGVDVYESKTLWAEFL
jgi:hypothetical protein